MKSVTFSAQQLRALNSEIQAVLNDTGFGFTSGSPVIAVMASDYSTDAFLRVVQDVVDGNDVGTETRYIRITFEGETDRDPQRNMYFQNVADRVHFFNSLYPVSYE